MTGGVTTDGATTTGGTGGGETPDFHQSHPPSPANPITASATRVVRRFGGVDRSGTALGLGGAFGGSGAGFGFGGSGAGFGFGGSGA
ncbi:MAG: PE family protein, partial [Candidatus Contendobacter sp.]|nr:PE family protein [Candidatus Contendobacter sp.]